MKWSKEVWKTNQCYAEETSIPFQGAWSTATNAPSCAPPSRSFQSLPISAFTSYSKHTKKKELSEI